MLDHRVELVLVVHIGQMGQQLVEVVEGLCRAAGLAQRAAELGLVGGKGPHILLQLPEVLLVEGMVGPDVVDQGLPGGQLVVLAGVDVAGKSRVVQTA